MQGLDYQQPHLAPSSGEFWSWQYTKQNDDFLSWRFSFPSLHSILFLALITPETWITRGFGDMCCLYSMRNLLLPHKWHLTHLALFHLTICFSVFLLFPFITSIINDLISGHIQTSFKTSKGYTHPERAHTRHLRLQTYTYFVYNHPEPSPRS